MSRYQRHIPLFTDDEFTRIRQAKVAVAGCGGLGSTVLQLLARIGFGTIHFWDAGILDLPDLNRQILYNTSHLDQLKVDTALNQLKLINPDIHFIAHSERLQDSSVIPEVDLVLDCLDSFASRLCLDKLFFNKGIPMIHASVFQDTGQLTTLFPGKTQNYQDTFGIEDNPEEQQIKTVFPPIVTTLASLQVNEAVKCITERYNQMLLNKLLTVDLKNNLFEIHPLI